MRCPYPQCQQAVQENNREHNVEHLADEIYLCNNCGRLSYQCVVNQDGLNRPFGHFCRRCGQCQFLRSRQQTASGRWEMVQQFDYDWEFVRNTGHNALPRKTTDVMVLNEKLQGFRANASVLIECSFIDGLLAIHQGGATMALLHPFRNLVSENIIEWQISEEELLLKNNCEFPQVRYHGDWFRPFTPLYTSDRRYGVFSTPYAVFAIDLGSLPAWQGIVPSRSAVVASWSERSNLRLAARPIPLTEQEYPLHQNAQTELHVKPNRLGLLLKDDEKFYWRVADLDETFKGKIIRGDESDQDDGACELPITGESVQVLDFDGSALILATSKGHWFWKFEDASNKNVDAIVPLSEESNDAPIELDRQVIKDRMYFSWKRQHLFSRADEFSSDREQKHFHLCYSRDNNSTIAAEMHSVSFDQPESSQRARPVAYNKTPVQYPIGTWNSQEGIKELLFIADQSGTIYRPIDGSDMGTLYAGALQSGNMTEIHGLQFNDPLLILVKSDYHIERAHTIEMRSMWHYGTIAVANGLYLKSDPLMWSNFLFTCETDKDDDRVFLRRREYDIQSHGTNPHISKRQTH
jgi:hypothetical protein